MQTILVVVLVTLVSALALALIGVVLRPGRKDDATQRAVGVARNLPRGGYSAMGERAPIEGERAS